MSESPAGNGPESPAGEAPAAHGGGLVLAPGPRRGTVAAPPSKSHAHRLLVANFLAGVRDGLASASRDGLAPAAGDAADVLATKRCLAALAADDPAPILDCGESGSTLRFLAPVAAALGKTPTFRRAGRLAERPFKPYPTLAAGLHALPGDVSSQFVTGLLFALPLLPGDSRIRFTSPLESRGYVDLTCGVLAKAGVVVAEMADGGYDVPGGQRYRPQPHVVEGDWSGAAFWLAMNALGSAVRVTGLAADSRQPDRAVVDLLARIVTPATAEVDVSGCPDLFPALAVAAAGQPRETVFAGIRRLRLKECDRVAAMAEMLARLGVDAQASADRFAVRGTRRPFAPCAVRTFGDHRIAMAAAVAATRAAGPVAIDDAACCAKSYPGFFEEHAACTG